MESTKKKIIEILSKESPSLNADACDRIAETLINQLYIKERFTADKSDFDEAVSPAIRYLLANHDPHTKIYIDYSGAELLQGREAFNLDHEIPD